MRNTLLISSAIALCMAIPAAADVGTIDAGASYGAGFSGVGTSYSGFSSTAGADNGFVGSSSVDVDQNFTVNLEQFSYQSSFDAGSGANDERYGGSELDIDYSNLTVGSSSAVGVGTAGAGNTAETSAEFEASSGWSREADWIDTDSGQTLSIDQNVSHGTAGAMSFSENSSAMVLGKGDGFVGSSAFASDRSLDLDADVDSGSDLYANLGQFDNHADVEDMDITYTDRSSADAATVGFGSSESLTSLSEGTAMVAGGSSAGLGWSAAGSELTGTGAFGADAAASVNGSFASFTGAGTTGGNEDFVGSSSAQNSLFADATVDEIEAISADGGLVEAREQEAGVDVVVSSNYFGDAFADSSSVGVGSAFGASEGAGFFGGEVDVNATFSSDCASGANVSQCQNLQNGGFGDTHIDTGFFGSTIF
ncbi:hypothetical protein HMH01_16885 [Halovulum dunhuangense]|uniref:Uncharacterized protein n=1 Tax=Halovulum dunhuangense TaxID=1505036 RepID=A0A849L6N5_9RHOB|nr:hypothetical protein [Halovulum dunhuangense]NNU82115.1 hypothetical protein [Halovulum dunhuangense]